MGKYRLVSVYVSYISCIMGEQDLPQDVVIVVNHVIKPLGQSKMY